ncbi:MAG: secondary thiamine-phosphate synthase enzyme YjbQ [Myxococcota bacterium]|nr:secondary thiamine-phosphate synthase enzyme YjbQ [Myxococcota bacterium]
MHQQQLTFGPRARGLHDITDAIASVVAASGVETGLAHVFVHHTSASLIIQENADPDVLRDLESFLSRLVPDGDPVFRHTAEGPDDMSAHVKAAITASAQSIPVTAGTMALGTWQGIFLWEHRDRATARRITVTIQG